MTHNKRKPASGPSRACLFGAALAALVAGCATPATSLIACPLSGEQQQQAVLEIVPRGTSRVEVERRLRKAGIEFSPGQKNSIYYLGLWNRPDGQRWHINVALLFDNEGRLYQTRPADSATEPLTNENQSAAWRQANSSGEISTGPESTGANAAGADGPSGTMRDDELQVPWPEERDSTKRRR
jgi:hypothetical protein